MIVVSKDVTVIAYIRLFTGVDYSPEQLIPDEHTGGNRDRLDELTLTEIAKKSGYERCTWSSHEMDGEINALFEKGKECRCNDAVGKSCNCSVKK